MLGLELLEDGPKRDESGRWLPGTRSPNPLGVAARDVEAIRLIRLLAQKYSARALKELFAMGLTCPHWPSRVAALREVLDRGLGKASTPVELSGPGGGPIPLSPDAFKNLTDEDLEALRAISAKLVDGEVV